MFPQQTSHNTEQPTSHSSHLHMVSPTLSWERVGKQFFRSLEGYHLRWPIDLAHVHIRVSPGGGVFAVYERTDVLRPESTRPQLALYSGSGNLLLALPYDLGNIVDAAFTRDERLIVASCSGVIRCYNIDGNFFQSRAPAPVLGLKVHAHGLVVRTQNSFVFMSSFPDPQTRVVDAPEDVSSWDVIYTVEDSPQSLNVVCFCNQTRLFLLGPYTNIHAVKDVVVECTSLCSSPDGMNLAILEQNNVRVYPSTFFRCILDAKLELESFKLAWCGNSALMVAGAYEKNQGTEVEVFALSDGLIEHGVLYYDAQVYLASEPDGTRVIQNDSHDLFCPVPKSTLDTFKLGSAAPSAMLLSTIELLDQGSPRANETLSLIPRHELPDAVDTCWEAAKHETDPRWQKRLLRAALYGKSSLDLYDSSRYLEAIDKIHIANSLRAREVGIFMTVSQMESLGYGRVLHRLEKRRLYSLALGVAKTLRLPIQPVYVEWGCSLIQSSPEKDDEELHKELLDRLLPIESISYVKLARKAYDEGRPQLALKLVERDPSTSNRIELQIEAGNNEQALKDAIEAGNSDLVYYVLLVLHSKLSLPQFYRVLGENPVAIKCYKVLCSLDDPTGRALHDFLYQMDLRIQDISLDFTETIQIPDTEEQITRMGVVRRRFKEIQQCQFEYGVTSEYVSLLTTQRHLEKEYERPFAGNSITGTIQRLLEISQVSRAFKLKRQFKISDEQFWWLRLKCLVHRRDWDGLFDLSQQRKSPIGYKPFYDECVQASNFTEAVKYVEMCTNLAYKDRFQMYIDIRYPQCALELAQKYKNEDLIRQAQDLL